MRRSFLHLLAITLLAPVAADAAAPQRLSLQLSARVDGEIVEAAGANERAELLTFDAGLADGLLVARPDEEVRVAGWPVAPGERADVVLTRREVYAPDAAIWEVGPQGRKRVPRSRLVFFWGEGEQDTDVRVMVSLDPRNKQLRGLIMTPAGDQELRPAPATWRAGPGRHVLGPPNLLLDPAAAKAVETNLACGQEDLPQELSLASPDDAAGIRRVFAEASISTLHTVRVLVETDNELLLEKFGNNTTAASDYLAQLFAGMNVIYERDLRVRLLQGTTFLRVSTTADPWGTSIADPTTTKLTEFTNYGTANYGGYFTGTNRHGLAMLLSGKSASTNSASGIAWVDSLCSASYGYSFTQVFKSASSTAASDVRIVAHEVGHNFGSPHTHCYNRLGLPYPDTCYGGEAGNGCFGGSPSCPASTTYNGVSARGTLMSYCHVLGGCSAASVFHPTSVDLLDDKVLARTAGSGACVEPAAVVTPGPTIVAISPNSGSTAGGSVVTITGAGFESTNPDSDVTVTFGGTAATNVNVTSSTTMTVTVPAHASGGVTVAVRNPDGQTASRANGYLYAPAAVASRFYTVTPCRLIDTRNPTAPRGGPAMGAAASRLFTVTGACGIPSTAKAVSVNVTVTAPGAPGHFEAFPGDAFPLGTGILGFRAGQTRAGNATLRLATDGTGRLGFANGAPAAAHLIVDVNGYFQ